MSSSEYTQSTLASQVQATARRPGRLRVRVVGEPPSEVPLDSGAAVTFGRSRAAQVVIGDQSVSKVHFSLRAVDGGVEIEDLGSKNGIWVGERRIRRMTLLAGDRFWAGEVCVELIDVDHVDVEVAAESEWGLLHGHSVVMRELFATLTKVSVLDFRGGGVAERSVEVEYGADIADVRLVPLPGRDGTRVLLVAGDGVERFDLEG